MYLQITAQFHHHFLFHVDSHLRLLFPLPHPFYSAMDSLVVLSFYPSKFKSIFKYLSTLLYHATSIFSLRYICSIRCNFHFHFASYRLFFCSFFICYNASGYYIMCSVFGIFEYLSTPDNGM